MRCPREQDGSLVGGFHDWTVRDLEDWKAKVNYIHMNPLKARLCGRAEDWSYSSASGRFRLDLMLEKYQNQVSGVEARVLRLSTPGLKPRPPKEGHG